MNGVIMVDVTKEQVQKLLAELAALYETKWIRLAFRCGRCAADEGEDCIGIHGTLLLTDGRREATRSCGDEPRQHTTRTDKWCRAWTVLGVEVRLDDLHYDKPSVVLAKIRKTKLYKAAVRDSKIIEGT